MAGLTGHEATVRAWEAQWGREGLWCKGCQHATPPYLLVVDGREATLPCERCGRRLARGESWLALVARLIPQQAVVPAGVS
jgi:hypothetical protein